MTVTALSIAGTGSAVQAAVERGVAWILGMQNPDGGWPSFTYGHRTKPPGPTPLKEWQLNPGLGDIRWEVRERMTVEPVATPREARVVGALGAAIQAVRRQPATLIASPGTYDQKHVVRIAGVEECVAYGPGVLETAHQPNEYVEIADLVDATKVMALATMALVGAD